MKGLNLPQEIVIFDVEVTTWEGTWERRWSGEGEYREVVQIGAVCADTLTLKEQGSFSVVSKADKKSEALRLLCGAHGYHPRGG
jgi:hypothetical protein